MRGVSMRHASSSIPSANATGGSSRCASAGTVGTTVTGIGPRLGVNILSGLPVEELLEAIWQQDAQRLQRVPGVGRKMSERMVVELKG